MVDLRNDRSCAKLEKVLGRELTPSSTERLDFADDPMTLMRVIAAHQAEKQMGALGQQPARAPERRHDRPTQ